MSLTALDMEELEALIEAEAEYQRYNRITAMYPDVGKFSRKDYPKHMECFEGGATYRQRGFLGGNGVGKSYGVGAYEMALHLTGDYPFWWNGLRFDGPIEAWACGDTRETVRDTVQMYLLGKIATEGPEALGTGTIPRDALGKPRIIGNTNGSCDFVPVKHVSGGWSRLQFKSYDQGRKAFQGTNIHFIWLDEEPPQPVFLECLQRGRGIDGRILLTFTPLSGHSDVVETFLSWEKTNQAGGSIVTFTCAWDDVPHLDEQWKNATLAATPPYLRDARRRGIPSAGIGKVYPVEEAEFVINPIPIPDHWRRVFGFDHGYFNTAAIWIAYDKDADTAYIYSDYKRGEVPLEMHAVAIKARGDWIPGKGDSSARDSDGQQIINKYKALGVRMSLPNKAVDAGIQEVLSRLSTGKLKVFSTCQKWLDEYRRYRYDEKQQIVKNNDHLMDACFTADTEVLTRAGWVAWPNAPRDAEFATMNLATGNLEYQLATDFVDIEWDGEIVALHNKTNLRVTPNHRMVVLERATKYQRTSIKRADELTIWDKIVTAPSGWAGIDTLGLDHLGCDDEVLAELIGWWIAEGSLRRLTPNSPRQRDIVISQVKPAGVTALRDLLDRSPWKWSYRNRCFITTNKALYELLLPYIHSHIKRVPQFIRDASPRLIEAFVRGYIAGDGWTQRGARCSATVSRGLADDLQELYLKLGKASSLIVRKAAPYFIEGRSGDNTLDQYWVLEHKKQTAQLRDSKNTPNFRRESYTGRVYCAQVPNGTLIVRRNGRVSVTGNTRYAIYSGLAVATTPKLIPSAQFEQVRFG